MKKIYIEENIDICLFEVLPGIVIRYEDFENKDLVEVANKVNVKDIQDEMIEISYCHEGNIECVFEGGGCVYMRSGDLYAGLVEKYPPIVSTLPAAKYKGVSIYLYVNKLSYSMPGILNYALGDINEFKEKLFPTEKYFWKVGNCINWVGGKIERIFLDLNNLPNLKEKAKDNYMKIKVVELLLLLSETCANGNKAKNKYYLKSQTELVKNIHDEIINDLSKNFTLKELSDRHGISQIGLKNCFKAMYGKSIAKYTKAYRMEYAAAMLRKTDETVMNISASVGYENQSKFAAAFKEVFGVKPTEYRKGDMATYKI
ncbi:AraC family transcriptional regulator [Clostridium sp. YIM B02555]|uniref:helix-turn-helix domain-containing protein n=1 Tax=Clostridium sp. YIM B02555 TaxID=2911968 RepID=UPI001EEEA0FD|nr:AraC family transcriptional regulator [Clostridium sp. YIM B02555]